MAIRPEPEEAGRSEWDRERLEQLSEQQREILRLLLVPPDQMLGAVEPLMEQGRYYEAARCLEISAQQHLGLMLDGEVLIDHNTPDFGAFHVNIHNLLWAGVLYAHNRHASTGRATLRRALLFVEEALRRIRNIQGRDNGQATCVGLAFEMAGHCSSAVSDPNCRDYYAAAVDWWDKSARICPEELAFWSHHPVTETVISCLNPVVAVKGVDEQYYPVLFSSDYRTRLQTARVVLIA